MDHTRGAGSMESGRTVTDTARRWRYRDGGEGGQTGRVEGEGGVTKLDKWKESRLAVGQSFRS